MSVETNCNDYEKFRNEKPRNMVFKERGFCGFSDRYEIEDPFLR